MERERVQRRTSEPLGKVGRGNNPPYPPVDKRKEEKTELLRDVRELLSELRQFRQWVAYRRVWNAGKGRYDKLPINPHDGSGAKVNDARTWGTFDEARRYASENGLMGNVGGIGFEFANGYAGIG